MRKLTGKLPCKAKSPSKVENMRDQKLRLGMPPVYEPLLCTSSWWKNSQLSRNWHTCHAICCSENRMKTISIQQHRVNPWHFDRLNPQSLSLHKCHLWTLHFLFLAVSTSNIAQIFLWVNFAGPVNSERQFWSKDRRTRALVLSKAEVWTGTKWLQTCFRHLLCQLWLLTFLQLHLLM